MQNTEHSEIIVVECVYARGVRSERRVGEKNQQRPETEMSKKWEDENNFQKYQRYSLSIYVCMSKGSTGTGEHSPMKDDTRPGTFILYIASFNHYNIFGDHYFRINGRERELSEVSSS